MSTENEDKQDEQNDILSLTGHQAVFSGKKIMFSVSALTSQEDRDHVPDPTSSSDHSPEDEQQEETSEADTKELPADDTNTDESPFPVIALNPVSEVPVPQEHPASDQEPVNQVVSNPEDSFLLNFFEGNRIEEELPDDSDFMAGLQSVFQTETDGSEEASEESPFDLSDSELFRREEALREQEGLDGVLHQNDADSLFELGQKYAAPDSGLEESSVHVDINPVSLLEAMLFVGDRENRPLSLERATALMRNVSVAEAVEAIDELNARYVHNDAPYEIVRDGEGFRMVLREEFESIRQGFFGKAREFKLSQKAIDVLAIVAYRQPVSTAEILEVRPGSVPILTLLTKRDLIAPEKRNIDLKQVVYFRTTPRFLKVFKIDSLDDLPIVDEVDFR